MASRCTWPPRRWRRHTAIGIVLAATLAGRARADDPACVNTPVVRQHAPVLAINGDSAVRGGKAAVTLTLERDDDERAVSADVVVHFRRSLTFKPPVIAHCKIAQRLAATHAVGGELLDSSHLSLSVFVRDFPIPTLGVGDLATCTFTVSRNAVFGATPLLAEDPLLADAHGRCMAVTTLDGQVLIVTTLPPTPTLTATPEFTQVDTPTSTPTLTALPPTATATAESTATAADSPTPIPPCVGDCGGDATVTSDDLIRALSISLGQLPLGICAAADSNGDGVVDIGELITAVHAALTGC